MFRSENLKKFPVFLFLILFISKFANGYYFCIPNNNTQLQAENADGSSIIAQFKTEVENFIREIQESSPIDTFSFDFTHPAITLKGCLKNFTIEVGDHELKFLNIKLPATLELFNFTFKNIMMKGSDYKLNGHVGKDDGLFKLYGDNGAFMMNPQNFSVAATVSLETNSSGLCIFVQLPIALQKMEVQFNHIMGGDTLLEPLFNKLIGSIAEEGTGMIWDELVNKKWDEVVLPKIINKYFHWDHKNSNPWTNLISWVMKNQNDIISGSIKL